MSDFIVPYPPFRDRRSLSGLGLRTILGNASPLSPQWDYARERAAETDDTGFRGAPNVEPPPDSPEYQNVSLQVLGNAAGAPPRPSAAGAAVGALGMADRAEWEIGKWLAGLTARAAPAALAAAPPLALSAPLIAIPKSIFDDQTLRLGDRFRASQPPGQKSVILERRVDDGLLGTGVGAKWEELPSLDAILRVGQYGLKTLVVDAGQLRSTLGPDVAKQLFATGLVIDRNADDLDTANRARTSPGGQGDLSPLPLSFPQKIEMRIGVSTDRGVTTTTREATREEVLQVCPNFARYEGYAIDADAKIEPLDLSPQRHGQVVHQELKTLLKMDHIQSRLEEQGVREMMPEIAIHRGKPKTYDKGYSKLDVLELHDDYLTVCVYDFKTGRTPPRLETIYRHIREGGLYAIARGEGYKYVYFIPIFVH